MYKIQTVNRVNKELLEKNPNFKEYIINKMLVSFAKEMFENECFEITETNIKREVGEYDNNEQLIEIKAFVMTPKEFKEVIEIFHLINITAPKTIKEPIKHLFTLFTQQPK